MILYEVKTPSGGTMRLESENDLALFIAGLRPNYVVTRIVITAVVIGADSDRNGGVVVPIPVTNKCLPTVMGALLAAHGDELLAWLGKRFTPMAAEPFKIGGKK